MAKGGEKKVSELGTISRLTNSLDKLMEKLNAIPGVTATYKLSIEREFSGDDKTEVDK